jgi:hypothetical protein
MHSISSSASPVQFTYNKLFPSGINDNEYVGDGVSNTYSSNVGAGVSKLQ